MNEDKKYLNWGVYLKPFKGIEVLNSTFVFLHHAHEWVKTFPPGAHAITRWIGPGAAPAEEHVTDSPRYL